MIVRSDSDCKSVCYDDSTRFENAIGSGQQINRRDECQYYYTDNTNLTLVIRRTVCPPISNILIRNIPMVIILLNHRQLSVRRNRVTHRLILIITKEREARLSRFSHVIVRPSWPDRWPTAYSSDAGPSLLSSLTWTVQHSRSVGRQTVGRTSDTIRQKIPFVRVGQSTDHQRLLFDISRHQTDNRDKPDRRGWRDGSGRVHGTYLYTDRNKSTCFASVLSRNHSAKFDKATDRDRGYADITKEKSNIIRYKSTNRHWYIWCIWHIWHIWHIFSILFFFWSCQQKMWNTRQNRQIIVICHHSDTCPVSSQ